MTIFIIITLVITKGYYPGQVFARHLESLPGPVSAWTGDAFEGGQIFSIQLAKMKFLLVSFNVLKGRLKSLPEFTDFKLFGKTMLGK